MRTIRKTKWFLIGGAVLICAVICFIVSSGNGRSIPAPVLVSVTQSNVPVRVYPGINGVFFILPDNSLWRWGQPGGRYFSRARVPEQVGTNCDWAQAFAANNHCLALRTNGTLWQWGWCVDKNQAEPTQVGAEKNWVGIAAGDVHATALKRDGTVWSWGQNSMGQLGNSSLLTQTNPVQLGTNRDWTAIGCGQGSYTCGLRKDGTLWVWGQIQGLMPFTPRRSKSVVKPIGVVSPRVV